VGVAPWLNKAGTATLWSLVAIAQTLRRHATLTSQGDRRITL
jgi:hypothetical protein